MGRATIISETGAGLYVIKPLYNNDFITAEITTLTAAIVAYDAEITTLTSELAVIAGEYDDIADALDDAIDEFNSDPVQEKFDAMTALTASLGSVTAQLSNKTRELGRAKLKKSSATKRKTKLENLVSDVSNRNAWNIAYVEGLSGEVNTIEINGEAEEILIGDFLDPSKLTEILGQTVAGSLYNFSLFPYWQKWNPTHRIGTITALSGNLATVSLAAATSHYQGLNINQASTLYNVPIAYLTCNEAAFEVGDEVVLGFTSQDWANPVIIGFRDNPAQCGTGVIDVGYSYPSGAWGSLGPFSWTAADIGGSSPEITMEHATTIPNISTNKLQKYRGGVVSYSQTTSSTLIFTVTRTIDYSYSGGVFTLKFKQTNTEASATNWQVSVVDTDSLNPTLSLSGPGLGTQYAPLHYQYIPGQYVNINNYTDGRLYIQIQCQVNIPGGGLNQIINYDFDNIKEAILGP